MPFQDKHNAFADCRITFLLNRGEKSIAAEREIPEELADHLPLPFGSGQGGFARVEAVHALTGGDVADIVPTVGNGAMLVRLEVGTLEDDPRHSVSPPCGQHRNGPDCSGVQSASSR